MNLLVVAMRLFGISGRYAFLIRAVVMSINLVNCVYLVFYHVWTFQCLSLTIRTSYYAYEAIHISVIYFWSVNHLKNVQSKPLSKIARWTNTHISVQLILCALSFSALLKVAPDELNYLHPSSPWKVLWTVMELLGSLACTLQMNISYTGIAALLVLSSLEVKQMVASLRPEDADRASRKAMIKCIECNETVSSILRLIFLEYGVRLLTEIPMTVNELGCYVESFNSLNCLNHLYGFLLIVSAGDRLHQSLRDLRRQLRKVLLTKQEQLQPFLRTDHGVHVAPNAILNWKSCCAFLGLCSTFSFMVFQYSKASRPTCTIYGPGACVQIS